MKNKLIYNKFKNIPEYEVDEQLEDLSEILRKSIIDGFEEYGLTIPQFYITNILLPENDPNFKRMRDLHTVSFQTKVIQAETLVKTAQIDAEAEVTAARRRIELEKQLTETEVAKREAEREIIKAQTAAESERLRAQAEAQAIQMSGMAEAEVMAAKGYNQRDVLAADVQKAYAEGIGNMSISGGSGGIAGDMLGLGVGMAAAGVVAPQLGEMFKGMNPSATPVEAATAKCAKCGATLPANAKFCLECGEKVAPAIPADMIVCPNCSNSVAKGKFCPECGHKFITVCPKCGKDVPVGAKFCLECGEKI